MPSSSTRVEPVGGVPPLCGSRFVGSRSSPASQGGVHVAELLVERAVSEGTGDDEVKSRCCQKQFEHDGKGGTRAREQNNSDDDRRYPHEDPTGALHRCDVDLQPQVRVLLASVRSSIRRNDWRPASDSLSAAIRIGPRTPELANLEAQVKAGLLALGTGTNPPPTPAPVPTSAPATEPTVAPKKVFDEAPVRQAIDAYVAAINSRNLAQVRAVYTGMTDRQASDWRENRFAKEIKRLTATATRPQIEETADGARAAFTIDLTLVPDGAAPVSYRIRCDALLKAEGGEWKIHSLLERGEDR